MWAILIVPVDKCRKLAPELSSLQRRRGSSRAFVFQSKYETLDHSQAAVFVDGTEARLDALRPLYGCLIRPCMAWLARSDSIKPSVEVRHVARCWASRRLDQNPLLLIQRDDLRRVVALSTTVVEASSGS